MEQPVQAASFVKSIEQSLNRINRQLCANMPSSKCKKFKTKSRHKSKSTEVLAVPLVVPPKTLPVRPLAPAGCCAQPCITKAWPADLNTHNPGRRTSPQQSCRHQRWQSPCRRLLLCRLSRLCRQQWQSLCRQLLLRLSHHLCHRAASVAKPAPPAVILPVNTACSATDD